MAFLVLAIENRKRKKLKKVKNQKKAKMGMQNGYESIVPQVY